MNKVYFPQLTSIRAVAAYLVYVHHFNPLGTTHFLYPFFKNAGVGIHMFFVLSGFLIYTRYAEYLSFSISSLWQFFRKRFARIFPLCFIFITIEFVSELNDINDPNDENASFLTYFLNITFLKAFFADYVFTLLPQTWSIGVQETFYTLFPLVLYSYKRKLSWFWQVFLLSLIGVLCVLIAQYFQVFGGFMQSIEFASKYTIFGFTLCF